jgi:hypothetical protein
VDFVFVFVFVFVFLPCVQIKRGLSKRFFKCLSIEEESPEFYLLKNISLPLLISRFQVHTKERNEEGEGGWRQKDPKSKRLT